MRRRKETRKVSEGKVCFQFFTGLFLFENTLPSSLRRKQNWIQIDLDVLEGKKKICKSKHRLRSYIYF